MRNIHMTCLNVLLLAGLAHGITVAQMNLQGAPKNGSHETLVDYVRPFVGTQGEGNTFPGPSLPFGMMQLGPDTDMELWETASGYEYADSSIIGFSLTHLNGTGIPDLGDFLFTPVIGTPKLIPGSKTAPDSGYRSRYSHTDEEASPGYYRVRLKNSGVGVELTTAARSGIIRLTFPATDSAFILTDLTHVLRWNVIWSNLRVENDSTVSGFHVVNGWAKDRPLYFAARYSRAFDDYKIMSDGKPVLYNGYRFRSAAEASGKNIQFLAHYRTGDKEHQTDVRSMGTHSSAGTLNWPPENGHHKVCYFDLVENV